MSKAAKQEVDNRSEAVAEGVPGDAVIKLRAIARELDYGVPVVTRAWRKQTARELEVIAEIFGGPAKPE